MLVETSKPSKGQSSKQARQKPTLKCVACGNCCPNTCRYKEKNLCLAHPTIIGEREAARIRGKCGGTPLEFFANQIYCPPVVSLIEEQLGLQVVPKRKPDGTIKIANFDEIAPPSRRLRGLE